MTIINHESVLCCVHCCVVCVVCDSDVIHMLTLESSGRSDSPSARPRGHMTHIISLPVSCWSYNLNNVNYPQNRKRQTLKIQLYFFYDRFKRFQTFWSLREMFNVKPYRSRERINNLISAVVFAIDLIKLFWITTANNTRW